MNFEYKKIETGHFNCRIIFFGQEKVRSSYVYSGNNVRDCYVLHYITSGKGTFSSAGEKMVHLKAGDAFLLPKSVPCFYQADKTEPWEYYWIGISGSSAYEFFSLSQFQSRYYIRQVTDSNFVQSLDTLFKTLHRPLTLVTQLEIEKQLFSLFIALLTDFPGQEHNSSKSSYDQFKAAEKLMRINLSNPFNVTDLSATTHLSRSYLHSLFKKYTKQSPKEYLVDLKMTEAKKLLLETEDTLQSVSSQVGYKDQFTFSKAFKRQVGQSPIVYRNTFKK